MRYVTGRVVLALFVLSCVSCVFFYSKVREADTQVQELLRSALQTTHCTNRIDSVRAIARAVFHRTNRVIGRDELTWYDYLEATSVFNVSAGVSLGYHGYAVEGHTVKGKCGTMSTAVLNCLWEAGIPARKLQAFCDTAGHTMVEFLADGRWLVISPSDSGFMWHRTDGQIATAADLHADKMLFCQLWKFDPKANFSFEHCYHLRWHKLPRPVLNILRALFSEETLESIPTPVLFEKCRTLFLVLSICCMVMCGIISFAAAYAETSGVKQLLHSDVATRPFGSALPVTLRSLLHAAITGNASVAARGSALTRSIRGAPGVTPAINTT